MTIKEIRLKNFKCFDEITVSFDPSRTYLVGPNGSGKTTIGMDAIWAIFMGVGEKGAVLKGDRRMFIKGGTVSENSMVLTDGFNEWTVTRRITPEKTTVEVICPNGEKKGQAFLDDLFDSAMLDPVSFARLSPEDQCKVLGIDTSPFNARIKALKEEHLFLGRDLKSFGDVIVPEDPGTVDVSAISAEKDRIFLFNRGQEELANERRRIELAITEANRIVDRLRGELESALMKVDDYTNKLSSTPIPQEALSTEHLDAKIRTASDTNAAHQAFLEASRRSAAKADKLAEISKNRADRAQIEAERNTYLQSQEMPFANITVDEDDRLLFNGLPIKEGSLSQGELIKLCIILTSPKRKKDLSYCFVRDFSLLDEDGQEMVSSYIESLGMQGVYEVVAKTSDKKNSIILEKVNR